MFNVCNLIRFREEDGEDENKQTWYYSTKVQLGELLEVLDKGFWENDLCSVLEEMREEIHTHMDITEELTNKARGNNKAYLTVANGKKIYESNLIYIIFITIFGNTHSFGCAKWDNHKLLLSLLTWQCFFFFVFVFLGQTLKFFLIIWNFSCRIYSQ